MHEPFVDEPEAAIVVADIDPEAAIVVADIDPELDIVLDGTPAMLEDMPVVLTPATATVVEAIIVLLGTEDVIGAEELAHDAVEGRVTPALRSKRQYQGLRVTQHSTRIGNQRRGYGLTLRISDRRIEWLLYAC
ncbi:hypothetical protein MMC17_004101 [Xylographa soralifera]|nr:hypothetical protein [Xylographa soralifera]